MHPDFELSGRLTRAIGCPLLVLLIAATAGGAEADFSLVVVDPEPPDRPYYKMPLVSSALFCQRTSPVSTSMICMKR